MIELTRRSRARPRFLNLLHLHYPVGAVCSFAHRVSGILLAIFAPALVWLLRRSLESPSGYEAITRIMHPFLAKGAALVFVWAFAHHALAGVRHLLMDIDRGSSLVVARRSAWTVNVLGVLIALLALGALA